MSTVNKLHTSVYLKRQSVWYWHLLYAKKSCKAFCNTLYIYSIHFNALKKGYTSYNSWSPTKYVKKRVSQTTDEMQNVTTQKANLLAYIKKKVKRCSWWATTELSSKLHVGVKKLFLGNPCIIQSAADVYVGSSISVNDTSTLECFSQEKSLVSIFIEAGMLRFRMITFVFFWVIHKLT